jgi:hypothetical protein
VVYDANVGDRLQFRAERNGEMWDGEILLEEGMAQQPPANPEVEN